jgi:hypothetical protein
LKIDNGLLGFVYACPKLHAEQTAAFFDIWPVQAPAVRARARDGQNYSVHITSFRTELQNRYFSIKKILNKTTASTTRSCLWGSAATVRIGPARSAGGSPAALQ